MLTVQEIKTLIENDSASTRKKQARIGNAYYNAEHDIKDYRIFYVNADGKLVEDDTRSNIKICHPFFMELVDQEVQYILSGDDGFIKSDIPELQTELDAYFNNNEDFITELYDAVTGCIAKGFDYVYAYKNKENRTAFACADGLGVVEVEARFASDNQDHILYWYVDRIDLDGNKIKRIQDWDSKQTYYYCQVDDGEIRKDKTVSMNPRPHIIYQKEGDTNTYYDSFGVIPFIRLDNCKKQLSGLKPIKDLIDDYDLISCGLSNNIQDTNEALYVVKGFQGDNLDELMTNIKAKKHIGVDEEGDVEIRTVDIPYQARQAKLDIDEKKIYHFGMGVNTEALKDSVATVSVGIKTAYAGLDLKTNKLEIRLKQFMRKLLDIVLPEINAEYGTDYRQKDVYFDFARELIINEQEKAQIELTEAQRKQTEITTLLNIATRLDNETLMQLICEQLDIDFDEIKDKLPTPADEGNDPYAAQSVLDGAAPDDDPQDTGEGDVIE